MNRAELRTVLLLWCLIVAQQAFCLPVHARLTATTTPSPTATTATPATTTATPAVTTAAPSTTTAATSTSTMSASGSDATATVTETPVGTVTAAAASSAGTEAPTTAPAVAVDTTYVCNANELARLETFNANNPYLQSTCSTSAGVASYAFPFNGELTYAQKVAMSSISACEYYFRGVLLVQLTECEVASVYVRTTAETVLQLVETSDDLPSEAEVSAAVEVRTAYNLALRGGASSASTSAAAEASSLSWTIEGDSLDTTDSASVEGQLIMNSDLQIVGTYYESSDSTTGSSEGAEHVSSNGNAGPSVTPTWLAVVVAIIVSLLLMSPRVSY
ncbi:hypothetical protein BBJ28_00012743 [Nothophytophthora sp. Chile5]|nr:hypothetical protein BBJ28_00012743 [Nothophytophthora sp. Chile5]